MEMIKILILGGGQFGTFKRLFDAIDGVWSWMIQVKVMSAWREKKRTQN